jgi:hypothetical protein
VRDVHGGVKEGVRLVVIQEGVDDSDGMCNQCSWEWRQIGEIVLQPDSMHPSVNAAIYLSTICSQSRLPPK